MNNYTDQIADVLSGNSDIRNISDDVIQSMLDQYPYSPYSHLVNYLKAKSTNRTDTDQLLQKLAVYSPDRAWLQTVLNTQFHQIDSQEVAVEATVPSEAKDPNLDKFLFEFDFNELDPSTPAGERTGAVKEINKDKRVSQNLASNPREEAYTPKQGSYIEWLKTMRLEHETQEDSTTNTVEPEQPAEIVVEKNTRKEDDLFGGIITETLAQLLANQGQIEKAINMYERLSLIFPDKSAFFAAKIEQLKSNIT